MATGEFPSAVRPGPSRAGAGQQSQAIDAHYYNITDIQAWPIAGLLVLLDGRGQPVRAELHVYDELPSHVQEGAVRQARMVLQEHYVGGDPVPLRILETQQLREAMDVRLAPAGERPATPRPRSWRPVALAVGGLVAVALLVWLVMTLLEPGEEVAVVPEEGPAPIALDQSAAGEVAAEGAGVPAAEGGQVAAEMGGGSDLPPSRNARPDLGIGMRVAIVPGLQLALRSEPGADAGMVVGAMGDGAQATIIGGPRLTRGDSDTIVWWLVELDNGIQAWAAANTSQQTLLVPAP